MRIVLALLAAAAVSAGPTITVYSKYFIVSPTSTLTLTGGPISAVASDGPWVSVAQGRSAYDRDRISIWNTGQKTVRLGRTVKTEVLS